MTVTQQRTRLTYSIMTVSLLASHNTLTTTDTRQMKDFYGFFFTNHIFSVFFYECSLVLIFKISIVFLQIEKNLHLARTISVNDFKIKHNNCHASQIGNTEFTVYV